MALSICRIDNDSRESILLLGEGVKMALATSMSLKHVRSNALHTPAGNNLFTISKVFSGKLYLVLVILT